MTHASTVEPVATTTRSAGAVRVAGASYPVSWIVGLLLFSSSTEVGASGRSVFEKDAGHAGVLAAQFVLTEGVPGVILGLVGWHVARSAPSLIRSILAISGLSAAIISLVQCILGLRVTSQLSVRHIDEIGDLSSLLSRLDGVKMLLLAILAGTMAYAVRRGLIRWPQWRGWVAAATAIAIAVSGVGYLFLANTLATAAWVSLPLLLIFVTASAFGGAGWLEPGITAPRED